jgi:hypothetical protein
MIEKRKNPTTKGRVRDYRGRGDISGCEEAADRWGSAASFLIGGISGFVATH